MKIFILCYEVKICFLNIRTEYSSTESIIVPWWFQKPTNSSLKQDLWKIYFHLPKVSNDIDFEQLSETWNRNKVPGYFQISNANSEILITVERILVGKRYLQNFSCSCLPEEFWSKITFSFNILTTCWQKLKTSYMYFMIVVVGTISFPIAKHLNKTKMSKKFPQILP